MEKNCHSIEGLAQKSIWQLEAPIQTLVLLLSPTVTTFEVQFQHCNMFNYCRKRTKVIIGY